MVQDRQYFEGGHDGTTAESWRVVAPVLARSRDGMIPARLETLRPETWDSDSLRRALRQSEAQRLHGAYLMAAAGHDLRQPLQVIAMALDGLGRSGLGARQLEWLSAASDEVANLSAGLTDLAVAAQLREPEFTEVRLDDVLAVAAESWRRHAAVRGLKLRIRRTDLVVRSDSRLLATILRNLVGNAVKHTSAGGVLVGCRRMAEGVHVEVIDTGPGLPGGADVFEPHRRGATSVEGLGLGLAIVRDAVERLDCTLSIRTTEGRGTRFSLTIPNWPRHPRTEAQE
jgi:signal transduction histidine kinase